MQSILDKLYDKTGDDAISEILSLYDQGEAVVVNFLYFAVIASQNLFEDGEKTEKEKEYKKILLKYYLMGSHFSFFMPLLASVER